MSGFWRKSGLSMSNSHCVEIKVAADGSVLIRDSKDPSGPVLTFTPAEWEAFSGGVAAGHFSDVAGRERWLAVVNTSFLRA